MVTLRSTLIKILNQSSSVESKTSSVKVALKKFGYTLPDFSIAFVLRKKNASNSEKIFNMLEAIES